MLDYTTLSLLVALAVGYAVFILFLGVAALRTRDSVQLRTDYYASRVRTLEEIEMERPFGQRIVLPFVRSLAALMLRLVPRLDLDELRLKLHRAGNPNNLTPMDFVGLRVLFGLLFGFAALGYLWLLKLPVLNIALFAILLGLLGYMLPVVWLGRKIRARQKEIARNLPDALDLLTVSVEAGLALEAAMTKVAEHFDNELGRAFARALTEVQVGRSRQDAMRDMAERADVPELKHFVTALIQAEQLGVSLMKVLQLQSDELRIKRRQRAEEEAHKAPVKMSVVLVIFLLPSLFLILLGPSFTRICHQFQPQNRLCGG